MIAPESPYNTEPSGTPEVLLPQCELFSTYPPGHCGSEELQDLLSRYLPRRQEGFDIEVALEVLRVKEEVVP